MCQGQAWLLWDSWGRKGIALPVVPPSMAFVRHVVGIGTEGQSGQCKLSTRQTLGL